MNPTLTKEELEEYYSKNMKYDQYEPAVNARELKPQNSKGSIINDINSLNEQALQLNETLGKFTETLSPFLVIDEVKCAGSSAQLKSNNTCEVSNKLGEIATSLYNAQERLEYLVKRFAA